MLLAQDTRLTRTVGAVTLCVLAAAIAFFVFIAGKIEWGKRVRLQVYFQHTGGLHEGAPVIVAGRTIGDVESLVPAHDDILGGEGIVATLALEADDAARIAKGGDVFVSGRGPLSARFIEIGPSPDPDGPALANGDRVRGIDPPTLDRVLQRTWDNLSVAKQFADELAPDFARLRGELRALAETLDTLVPSQIAGVASLTVEVDALVAEVRRLRDVTLGGDPGLARIAEVLARARATTAQARRVIDLLGERGRVLAASVDALRARIGPRGDGAIASLEAMIDRTRAAIDKLEPLRVKLDEINARIARGEGSALKLARDPEFPEDAKELGKIMKRHPWRIIAHPKD